jgi:hypothetical protein
MSTQIEYWAYPAKYPICSEPIGQFVSPYGCPKWLLTAAAFPSMYLVCSSTYAWHTCGHALGPQSPIVAQLAAHPMPKEHAPVFSSSSKYLHTLVGGIR